MRSYGVMVSIFFFFFFFLVFGFRACSFLTRLVVFSYFLYSSCNQAKSTIYTFSTPYTKPVPASTTSMYS